MDGLQQIVNYRPHVLLLDLQLPDINGVDVLERVRAAPSTKEMPVIVFSNAFLSRPIKEARDAGATDVISKADCPMSALTQRIGEILAKSTYEPPA